VEERLPALLTYPRSAVPGRLPAEMLNNIMSRLDFPSLARVALASQVMNTAATECLYSSVTPSTLATLLARPDLRQLAKEAVLPYEDLYGVSDRYSDEEDNLVLPMSSPGPSPEQIQILGIDESLVQALEHGARWAQAVFLLYLLPSLERLDMVDWGLRACGDFFSAAVPIFGVPSPLQVIPGLHSLRYLECSYGDIDGGFDAEIVLRMLVLPSLASLTVHAV
jgi:hypothetical protein